MVILIVAGSGIGKTLMAQRLLEIYQIPYLSMDHLKMGLYRAGPNCSFTPTDSNRRIENVLWPIVKGIIETIIENGQSIIIEGCYASPDRLRELSAEYAIHVIPVFMGFSKAYVKSRFSDIIRFRNAIETRLDEEARSVDQIIAENEELKAKCEACAVRFFSIETNYREDTEKVFQWIAEQTDRLKPSKNNPVNTI